MASRIPNQLFRHATANAAIAATIIQAQTLRLAKKPINTGPPLVTTPTNPPNNNVGNLSRPKNTDTSEPTELANTPKRINAGPATAAIPASMRTPCLVDEDKSTNFCVSGITAKASALIIGINSLPIDIPAILTLLRKFCKAALNDLI